MADQLTIYRGALRRLGDGRLSSLTDNDSRRLKLDDAWAGAVNFMLEQGLWNFAIRTIELSADDDYEPLFGAQYSFRKPDDWVRTNTISTDPYFKEGFEEFHDEGDYWFANIEPLYIRYVSNSPYYGWNIGRWRENFARALEAWLAFDCGLPISNDKGNRNDLFQIWEKLLKVAKSKDAVDEAVQRPPTGRLVKSRLRSGSRMNG